MFWNRVAHNAGWQLDWRGVRGTINEQACRVAAEHRTPKPELPSKACRRQSRQPGLIRWSLTCVVHLIRAANRWVPYGDRKAVSAQLKKIYTAPTEDTARAALEELQTSELGVKYPQSAKMWRDAWVKSTRVVRRIPELNKKDVDQSGLFDLHRFHAVFTTADPGLLDTVAADKTHQQHAIIEQVNANLKASALVVLC